jgi:hypothetical protein
VKLEYPIEICNTGATLASTDEFSIQLTPGLFAPVPSIFVPANTCVTQVMVVTTLDGCDASSTLQLDVFVRSAVVCPDGASATFLVKVIPSTPGR